MNKKIIISDNIKLIYTEKGLILNPINYMYNIFYNQFQKKNKKKLASTFSQTPKRPAFFVHVHVNDKPQCANPIFSPYTRNCALSFTTERGGNISAFVLLTTRDNINKSLSPNFCNSLAQSDALFGNGIHWCTHAIPNVPLP